MNEVLVSSGRSKKNNSVDAGKNSLKTQKLKRVLQEQICCGFMKDAMIGYACEHTEEVWGVWRRMGNR